MTLRPTHEPSFWNLKCDPINSARGFVLHFKLLCIYVSTGRSRVRFPMMSLKFFSDIILPVALWPWGRLSRCVRLTTLPLSCAVVMKSGNLNFLEPSGPLQACNGTALPLCIYVSHVMLTFLRCHWNVQNQEWNIKVFGIISCVR